MILINKIRLIIIGVSLVLLIFFMPQGWHKKNNIMSIGILQTASHPALDAVREGFVQHFRKNLNKEIRFVVQNAEGSLATAHMIAQQMHNDDSIVGICSIATLATQAIAHVEKKKPIFFAAVSDPHALGVIHPGTNVCGTSDATDVEAMVQGLKTLVPQAKKVALLFNPAEANSVAIVEKLKHALDAAGLQWILAGVSSEAEIAHVVRVALQNADALIIPPDNTVACAIKLVGLIAWQEKKPVILSDKMLLSKGILAVAGGVDYNELGRESAECALSVLRQKIKPDQLPIKIVADKVIHVHKETLEHLGLHITQDAQQLMKIEE